MRDRRDLELIWAGDPAGLSRLFDRHGAACLRAAQSAMSCADKAEDLVFEVFLMIWRHPPPTGMSMRDFLIVRIDDMAREQNMAARSALHSDDASIH